MGPGHLVRVGGVGYVVFVPTRIESIGEMVKCSIPFCDGEIMKCYFLFCDGEMVKCYCSFCDGEM